MKVLLFLGWVLFLFLCVMAFAVFGIGGVVVLVLLVGGGVAIFANK